MIPFVVLSFASGIPALVYQLVWTRQVGLIAGSQIEAISLVLVAFFGGLALGSRLLGRLADGSDSPLVLYARLEGVAGLLALLSPVLLAGIDFTTAAAPGTFRLGLSALCLLPATFALGGTLPALLRAAAPDALLATRAAGWLVGANTAGAVTGVGLATWAIPVLGLQTTLISAGLGALAIAAVALMISREAVRRTRDAVTSRETPHRLWLILAAWAGVPTLAYEVLVTRAATLQLGSSLYAWSLTLALFLAGLALGNLFMARRASRHEDPAAQLFWVETAIAVLLGLSTWALPGIDEPARGLRLDSVASVAMWILPASLLMGAAFPLLVRGALRSDAGIGDAFGRVSAANTLGGVAGSLLAPFALLPLFGLKGAILACSGLSGLFALVLMLQSVRGAELGWRRPTAALGVAVLLGAAFLQPGGTSRVRHVVFAEHGRQASAAVVHVRGRRDLIVDGDTEASTFGDARRTEELLAAIPLLHQPRARRFLEVGLGSGITLGAATRFPLESVACVEISQAVLHAGHFFTPDNRGVTQGVDSRVRLTRGDGRAYLLSQPGSFDVIVANTVHPWSVGSTGLYSVEYFGRLRRSLAPGGVAAQWLPVHSLGHSHLAAILRTFFRAFPEGHLYWAADSVIVVGAAAPLAVGTWPDDPELREWLSRLGLSSVDDLGARRLADADTVRDIVGDGLILSDDRPLLEAGAASGRAGEGIGGEDDLIEQIAGRSAAARPELKPLHVWLRSRAARDRGKTKLADSLLELAATTGLDLAARDLAGRQTNAANELMRTHGANAAIAQLRKVLARAPRNRAARMSLSILEFESGRAENARREVELVLDAHPDAPEAWNLLATIRHRLGDLAGARLAIEQGLKVDPFFPEAWANAGLLAHAAGDRASAEQALRRLRSLSPLGPGPVELALTEALSR